MVESQFTTLFPHRFFFFLLFFKMRKPLVSLWVSLAPALQGFSSSVGPLASHRSWLGEMPGCQAPASSQMFCGSLHKPTCICLLAFQNVCYRWTPNDLGKCHAGKETDFLGLMMHFVDAFGLEMKKIIYFGHCHYILKVENTLYLGTTMI